MKINFKQWCLSVSLFSLVFFVSQSLFLKESTAMVFNGIDDYVSIPITSPNTNYTYELRFKTTKEIVGISSVRFPDLGGDHDRDLWINKDLIHHRLWKEETIKASIEDISDGNWHHIVITVEKGVGQKIYLDGVLVATGEKSSSNFDWNQWLNIGYTGWKGAEFFEGEIKDVRLYNEVLPYPIIKKHNKNIFNENEKIIGYWPLEKDTLNHAKNKEKVEVSQAVNVLDIPESTNNEIKKDSECLNNRTDPYHSAPSNILKSLQTDSIQDKSIAEEDSVNNLSDSNYLDFVIQAVKIMVEFLI